MDDLEAKIKTASAQIMQERKGLYDMLAADDEDMIKMINERAAESSARAKLVADRDVIEFLNTDDLLGKISVEPIDQIIDHEKIVAALEHVDLLFLIADEDNIKPIAAIAQKVRMERFCERRRHSYVVAGNDRRLQSRRSNARTSEELSILHL